MDVEPLRSIQGYPKSFAGSVRYDGTDLAIVDGDLTPDLSTIGGAPGIGQGLAMELDAYFADYGDPVGFAERVDYQAAPKPEVRRGEMEEFLAETLWEMENDPELRTVDPRGMSISARVDGAIEGVCKYLKTVSDVRFNGHDMEIDYEAEGYECHVVRINDLIPRSKDSRFGLQRPIPIRRGSLLEVEELSNRLLAHLRRDPSLLNEINWRTFERLVAELIQQLGWDVLELTRKSKDGGVDIFAARKTVTGSALAVIDCKQYNRRLGVDQVRAVAGLKLQHSADIGMLVTTSFFTKGARDLEQCELKDHVQLHDVERVKEWLDHHQWEPTSGLYLPRSRFASDEE